MIDHRRNTGIDLIGDVPWATHFCQFYETRNDLIDILVPYFVAGLLNNKFCVWVTSEDLSTQEAKDALRNVLPDLDGYLLSGQLEIFPYDTWYLQGGSFDQDRVLGGWVDKLNYGLSRGYDGIRISGNTCWLENSNWDDFATYENAINDVIGDYKMLVLCTYSLNKCGASEIAEVVSSHQFALIMREGKWETIEASDYKQSKELLRRERDFTSAILDTAGCLVVVLDRDGRIVRTNHTSERLMGYSSSEVRGRFFWDFLLIPEEVENAKTVFSQIVAGQSTGAGEGHLVAKDGARRLVEWSNTTITTVDGAVLYVICTGIDVTERRKAEDALRTQVHLLQQALLPSGSTVPTGYRLASTYVPAFDDQEIGGDFYDVFTTAEGRVGILIGDVAGKGIEAASFAAATRSTVRAFAHSAASCGEALTHANSVLCAQQEPGNTRFATAFLLLLDPATGVISYSSAGHPSSPVRRTDGRIEFLSSEHIPIGIMDHVYSDRESRLEPGDKVMLYTDGISEARLDTRLFGQEGIEQTLQAHGDREPEMLISCLLDSAKAWAGGRTTDDIAVVLLERRP